MRKTHLLILVGTLILLSSCKTTHLFQKGKKLAEPTSFEPYVHTLVSDDKISISIWDHDKLSVGSVYGVYSSNEVYGKWVMIDPKGFAKLPVIGDVKLGGLTLNGAKDTLANIYGKFVKEPVIEIKVLNLDVTVLGEVGAQGNYTLDKTHNDLIELLGLAGGLNFYSDNTKIKIVRGNISNGTAVEYQVDLTNMDDLTTGKLNIHPGDVVYVPAKKGKALEKKAPLLVPFASTASALAVIASFLLIK